MAGCNFIGFSEIALAFSSSEFDPTNFGLYFKDDKSAFVRLYSVCNYFTLLGLASSFCKILAMHRTVCTRAFSVCVHTTHEVHYLSDISLTINVLQLIKSLKFKIQKLNENVQEVNEACSKTSEENSTLKHMLMLKVCQILTQPFKLTCNH